MVAVMAAVVVMAGAGLATPGTAVRRCAACAAIAQTTWPEEFRPGAPCRGPWARLRGLRPGGVPPRMACEPFRRAPGGWVT